MNFKSQREAAFCFVFEFFVVRVDFFFCVDAIIKDAQNLVVRTSRAKKIEVIRFVGCAVQLAMFDF